MNNQDYFIRVANDGTTLHIYIIKQFSSDSKEGASSLRILINILKEQNNIDVEFNISGIGNRHHITKMTNAALQRFPKDNSLIKA